jgi:hypothetical protein
MHGLAPLAHALGHRRTETLGRLAEVLKGPFGSRPVFLHRTIPRAEADAQGTGRWPGGPGTMGALG